MVTSLKSTVLLQMPNHYLFFLFVFTLILRLVEIVMAEILWLINFKIIVCYNFVIFFDNSTVVEPELIGL